MLGTYLVHRWSLCGTMDVNDVTLANRNYIHKIVINKQFQYSLLKEKTEQRMGTVTASP